jgi:putative transposase
MYEYRKLTETQRKELLAQRRARGFPLHAPPHFPDGRVTYLLTAATFEHQPFINSSTRRADFTAKLIGLLASLPNTELHAWVVLPNHYHLLASLDLAAYRKRVRSLHSGIATQWNREDQTPGRQVWFRFSDRAIRGERHYYATLNYIHANPVKHRYVKRADDWLESSIHEHLRRWGRQYLVELWEKYPVDKMGEGWDD